MPDDRSDPRRLFELSKLLMLLELDVCPRGRKLIPGGAALLLLLLDEDDVDEKPYSMGMLLSIPCEFSVIMRISIVQGLKTFLVDDADSFA